MCRPINKCLNILVNKLLRNPTFLRCIDFFIDAAATFTRYIGKLFVILVFILTSLVLVSYYFCLLPYVLDLKHEFFFIFHVVIGHWLLTNIIFHYYHAVKLNPGFALNVAKVDKKDVNYFRRTYPNQRICKHCCQVKDLLGFKRSLSKGRCQKVIIRKSGDSRYQLQKTTFRKPTSKQILSKSLNPLEHTTAVSASNV